MPPNSRNPITPRFVIGVCLVLAGVVLALDQLGVIQANHVLRFWPAALIVAGLAMLQHGDRHGALRALVLIVVGGWLLLNTLGLVSLDLWEFIWPLLLVLFGARIMLGNRSSGSNATPDQPGGAGPGGAGPGGAGPGGAGPGGAGPTAAGPTGAGLTGAGLTGGPSSGPTPSGPGGFARATAGSSGPGHASLFSLLSSSKRRWGQSVFRSAEATVCMGGCELDLREALMAGGEPAVVEVFVLMGGINIFVPVNWTVSQEVVPLFGGVDDKTRSIPSNPAQHLLVRGTVVMGGVEISN